MPASAATAAAAAVATTAAQEIAAGVFAGVTDALAIHPIDQVKTQFHINTGKNTSIVT